MLEVEYFTQYFDNNSKVDYSDMGAMRIPTWHLPFFDLVKYLNS